MAKPRDAQALAEQQSEIEAFLKSLAHPVLVEDGVEVMDLTAAEWRLSVEFGKLIFQAWNPARSIARRVEELAYRDRGRLGLFVVKPGGRQTGTIEFRELDRAARPDRAPDRTSFRRQLLAMLAGEFPGWRFERVSQRSDREHTFSTWYTRGLARRGTTGWAFLGLAEGEAPAAADAALAHGLIWLDWLRHHTERASVSGLKLFLPRRALELTAHRSAHLNRRALQVEIFDWPARRGGPPQPVDLQDYGNVETRLVPHRRGEEMADRHRPWLQELLGDAADQVDIVPDPAGDALSVRVLGLEVARVEGELAPRAYFGLEGNARRLDEARPDEFRQFLRRVLQARAAQSPDREHEFYRLQAERWLEALLVRDLTRIDPALSPAHVYPQVPAFSGTDRGVIDILSVTQEGRLAVVELKLDEAPNLPLQGLDYWLRVKWLHQQGQFQRFGYFSNLSLTPESPLLYLVAPAFRFHPTNEQVVRYLDPAIKVIQVGLNNQWREGVRVLFRRPMREGRAAHPPHPPAA